MDLKALLRDVNRVKRWFDERRIVERKSVFEHVEGDGDLLFVRGKHLLRWDNGAADETWFAHFFHIEDDRIARFEQFMGM